MAGSKYGTKEDREWLLKRSLNEEFLDRLNGYLCTGMPSKEAKVIVMKELREEYPDPKTKDEIAAAEAAREMINALPEKSSPAEMIQWVAGNILGDIDFTSCPGRDAYALLMDCKKTPAFRLDFWKSMYTRLVPSRAQLNDEDFSNELDGESTIKVLSKISDISKKAKAGVS